MEHSEGTGGARRPAAVIERANRRLNIGEATSIGLTEGLAGFVPILVARLGGSSFEVGLLASIVGLVGLVFATPGAAIVRHRPQIVRTYSLLRLLAYLRYGVVAVAVLVLPSWAAVLAILVTWAIASIPGTLWTLATPVVIEGISGSRGRVDLLAIRWSLMEIGSITSSALGGVALTALGVPVGYAVVMSGAAAMSVVAFAFARRYRITAAVPDDAVVATNPWRVARGALAHSPFRRHLAVRVLLLGGIDAMGTLVTLLLVRVLLLQDSDIGVLLAVTRIGTISGYVLWRRLDARPRSPRILLLAAVMAAPYPLVLAFTSAVPGFGLPIAAIALTWGGLAVSGVSLGLWDESIRAMPADRRLPFFGVLYSIDYAIILVVPILAAALADTAGIPAALAASGVAMGLGAVVQWVRR